MGAESDLKNELEAGMVTSLACNDSGLSWNEDGDNGEYQIDGRKRVITSFQEHKVERRKKSGASGQDTRGTERKMTRFSHTCHGK